MPVETCKSWQRWLAHAAIGAATLLVVFYVVVRQWPGTPAGAWALLQGDAVTVTPATVDLGECRMGEAKEMDFGLVNHSSRPVTVTGMYTSCSCLLASALPIELGPHCASVLRLTIHASGDRGEFSRQAIVYTDCETSPELSITVLGTIVGEAAALEPIAQPADVLAARHE
jgi:hypothetical protein